MSKRNPPKKAPLQSKVEKSNECMLPSPSESESASDNDDDGASFQSAVTVTDQSRYSFDYSDTSQTMKRSRSQQHQLNTKKPKESSSTQNEQQNEEGDSSDDDPIIQEFTDSNMGVMLTTSLHEVETDDEDVLTTSSIRIENHQVSNSSSEMSPRQSVDRNELKALPNRVELQTQRKPRKTTKPKKTNMDDFIAAYKQTTTNLMPKRPFQRLSVEILRRYANFRFTKEALSALQESSELYLTHLFEDSYRLALHRNAVTLKPIEMQSERSVTYIPSRTNVKFHTIFFHPSGVESISMHKLSFTID